jgi:membrane-associated protease RseP (regulator of RpoE activity)
MPVPTGYFLGVTTTTVPVGQGVGQQPVYSTQGGSQTRVAPGYGQPVDGQLVTRVIPNSPAFHAGLEVGDILLDANGYPLDSREDLIAAIQNSQGYLEIKVIDGRTNQLAWVVARTGATDPTPVFGTRNQDSVNGPHQDRLRPALRTGLRDSIQTFNAPLNLETGGRRPPIARRGR